MDAQMSHPETTLKCPVTLSLESSNGNKNSKTRQQISNRRLVLTKRKSLTIFLQLLRRQENPLNYT
jgi:hypothetical protein